jgi:EAL domain-containing protein (putative c-di-GMP-specific phosphodiesterase class I)
VRIAIDDFGAGFSSLARLRHLTVHTLKLDRSFLHDVPGDARAGSFMTAIIGLAAQLKLSVVAEGIETAGQLDFLVSEGTTLGQGYLLARPMPAADATELLQCSGRGGPPRRSSRQGT